MSDRIERLRAWAELHDALWSLPPVDAPKNESIKREIQAFRENFARVRNLFSLADLAFIVGRVYQQCVAAANMEVFDRPGTTPKDDPEQVRAATAMALAWYTGADYHPPIHVDMAEMVRTPGLFTKSVYYPDDSGFHGLLFSIVTAAWTAFEVLAADLWIAALNSRPDLGVRALNAEINESDSEPVAAEKRKKRIELPVHQLRDWSFDLKGRMGSLLAQAGPWDFARKDHTRNAYLKAFPAEAEHFKGIFDDQSLRWLAATRNAIVHNAARADAEFKRIVHAHPKLGSLNVGDPIPADVDVVRELTVAAALKGWDLIGHVDRVIRAG